MTNKIDKPVEILENNRLAPNVMEMVLDAPHIAETAQPGQFVNLFVERGRLRRPFTISAVDNKYKTVTVRYRVGGKGTKALANMKPGTELLCMGPLGNGFSIKGWKKNKFTNNIIIGGGMGSAFVPFMEQKLSKNGSFTDIIVGGKTKKDICFWNDVIASPDIWFMTEDGTHGHQGLVTDILRVLLQSELKYEKIYTCGPVPMMKAVYEIAKQFDIDVECALESEMGCGYNVCKSCTCKGSDGKAVSICKDGPVLSGDKIDWEYLEEKEDQKKQKTDTPDFTRTRSQIKNSYKFDLNGFLNDNPYIAASGCAGFGIEQDNITDMSNFGAISLKGLTRNLRFGNPGTRIKEIPCGGIMNSIGLENPGVEYFVNEISPKIEKKFDGKNTKIIANISAATPQEFAEMIHLLNGSYVDAYEINVSCPNLDKKIIGTNAQLVFDVTKAAHAATLHRPIFVKLTPNVANIGEIAAAAESAGAQAISLVNTVIGYDMDPKTGRSILYNGIAGMSHHAVVREIALAKTIEVVKSTGLPVIAGGGIWDETDIVRFALAGADAFSIGTELLPNPGLMETLPARVKEFLARYWGGKTLGEITGAGYLNNEGRTIADAKLSYIKSQNTKRIK
ncbi:MAG: FAD-binding oxidoreductase [Alphaproteobacteria bacterium]|nr:FAD-binding oxidoreductase [Alphaproteobacteria bacterium]